MFPKGANQRNWLFERFSRDSLALDQSYNLYKAF